MVSFQQTPHSFSVREILFFEPEGQGEHCFGYFEKESISTADLKRAVSVQIGVPLDQIKHAGLKDAQAHACQWLSWPSTTVPESIQGEGFRLLKAARHPHSLSIGHIRENHFSIRIQGCLSAERFEGPFLNLFGAQRNMPGLNQIGEMIAQRRKWTPFTISQIQASLFNAFVLWRYERNQAQPEPGDLWRHVHSKKTFSDDDFELLMQRFQAGEISPTGPIFGTKSQYPKHNLEQDFLQQNGLSEKSFESWRKKGRGARRPIWVWPGDFTLQSDEKETQLSFSLPSGSFATVLLLWALDRNRLLQLDFPNFIEDHVFPD